MEKDGHCMSQIILSGDYRNYLRLNPNSDISTFLFLSLSYVPWWFVAWWGQRRRRSRPPCCHADGAVLLICTSVQQTTPLFYTQTHHHSPSPSYFFFFWFYPSLSAHTSSHAALSLICWIFSSSLCSSKQQRWADSSGNCCISYTSPLGIETSLVRRIVEEKRRLFS